MIKLDLTIEEINYILFSVGKNPYSECAQLVSKIHMQAQPQIPVKTEEVDENQAET